MDGEEGETPLVQREAAQGQAPHAIRTNDSFFSQLPQAHQLSVRGSQRGVAGMWRWGGRCSARPSTLRVQGSGFRVQGSGFRVQGSGFRVQGSGLRQEGAAGEEQAIKGAPRF